MADPTPDSNGIDFMQASAAFVRWFTLSEATRLNPKVELAGAGTSSSSRGALAISDVAEDEELFAVPRSLVLDITNSDLQKHIGQSLQGFGSWDSLIVTIIYEYLRKEASPWYPYFGVLPVSFDTLMFWTAAELEQLQGSAVLGKIGKETAEESWKTTIIPFMLAHRDIFPVSAVNPESELIGLAHMAGSLIMAYAFDLEKTDEEEEKTADEDGFVEDDEEDPSKGMVPFADMLNADADRNNARLFHEEDFLIMKATRPIPAGSEIFNDYGPLPRSDLLRMYGYVTNNYAQYDVVEISSQFIHDIADSLRKKHKKPKNNLPPLEDLDFVEDGYALSRPAGVTTLNDTIPVELHMLLSAVSLEQNKIGFQRGTHPSPKPHFSRAEADLLDTVLRKRLEEYPTSLSEDEKILEHLRAGHVPRGVSSERLQMAVQVRQGEKEVLQHLARLTQEHIADLTSGKRKRDGEDTKPCKSQKSVAKR